jgi:thymidylate synthase ThyX
MQADEENDALIYGSCGVLDMVDNRVEGVGPVEAWNKARDRAIEVAQDFHRAGYHKQVVNRILEPFMHIDVIMTTTAPDNFYHLRSHKDAQPEIKVLSDAMLEAHRASTPRQLRIGEWHMPYIRDNERDLSPVDLLKMSVARCARVSYLTHDGKEPDLDKDVALYERLVGSTPLHASPAEHQACPDMPIYAGNTVQWDAPHRSGNFDEGWLQYRKTLPGEVCLSYEAA